MKFLSVKKRDPVCSPVFIWGLPQSGTFLLYDICSLSNEFCFHYTTDARKKGLSSIAYGKNAIRMERKPIEGIQRFWGGVGLPWEQQEGWIFNGTLRANSLSKYQKKKVRKRYLNMLESDSSPTDRQKTILDKFPNYALMLGLIDDVFPSAKHIFVIRDPRMVLNSIVLRFKQPNAKEGWKGYPSGFYSDTFPKANPPSIHSSLEDRHHWQIEAFVDAIFQHKDTISSKCLCLHYELICNDIERSIDKLEKHLSISFTTDSIEGIKNGMSPAGTRIWPFSRGEAVDFDKLSKPDSLQLLAQSMGYHAHKCGVIENPKESLLDFLI